MKEITLKEISALASGTQVAQGFKHVKNGDVLTPWVGDETIGGQVKGAVRPFTARIRFGESGKPSPTCTCQRRSRQTFCQHAMALLIAWATQPEGFRQYRGPDTAPLVGGGQVRREQDPLVAFRVTLDKVEALLFDLLSHGLVTLNAGRAKFIREMHTLATGHGLGRIASALGELNAEVSLLVENRAPGRPRREFDEARYAGALSTAWALTQLAREALDAGDLTRLRELTALEVADEPAEILEDAVLVGLAYHVAPDQPNVETNYLLALESGQLLAERIPKPVAPASTVRRKSVVRGRVAVYPASDVDEVVLLDAEAAESPDAHVWEQACRWAEVSCGGLVSRLREVAARLPGTERAHVWFAPSHVVVRADGVSFLDDVGEGIRVEPSRATGRVLLDGSLLAAFGTVGRSGEGLRFEVLSLLVGGDAPDMVALRG